MHDQAENRPGIRDYRFFSLLNNITMTKPPKMQSMSLFQCQFVHYKIMILKFFALKNNPVHLLIFRILPYTICHILFTYQRLRLNLVALYLKREKGCRAQPKTFPRNKYRFFACGYRDINGQRNTINAYLKCFTYV